MSEATSAPQVGWIPNARFIVVSAMRTLAGTAGRIRVQRPDWVVVVRTHRATGQVFHYAWRSDEILERSRQCAPEMLESSLEEALNLHEDTSSFGFRSGRATGAQPAGGQPENTRAVDLSATGQVIAIGELTMPSAPAAPRRVRRMRGGPVAAGAAAMHAAIESEEPHPAAAQAPQEIEAMLSAQGPAEVMVGQMQAIEFRLEAADGAQPLAHAAAAVVNTSKAIRVLLSLQGPGLSVVGSSEQVMVPPNPGQPSEGVFQIRGEAAGMVRVAVSFRQGGSELASVGFAIDVVATPAAERKLTADTVITTPDPADDELLTLLIEQKVVDGATRYEYRLHSEALGFNYLTLQSAPLLDRGDGHARTLLDYVSRIYERTTRELATAQDLKDQQRELRALGVSLSSELFDPDVVRKLWPLRSRIGVVCLTSWEPYVPWELLRMRDPDTREVDGRFLAEYGLVRTLAGEAPPRKLALRDWRWLAAEFPMGTHLPAGDMGWFTDTLSQQYGIAPQRIHHSPDALLDTLAAGDFDVLHLACHSESPQNTIDRANLILADRVQPGGTMAEVVQVDTASVDAEAKLRARRPLVFLNACETGRLAPNLTAWGGWPEVFLRAGAGAFVGTSWAVQAGPAASFAKAFYGALLADKTLHEAADAARKAAQEAGDASWLAFKVYGHPRARRG
jgi:hypothetical protein